MAAMQERLNVFVQDLAAAVGTLVKGQAELAPGAVGSGDRWVVALRVEGEPGGECVLTIGAPGAAALARVATGRQDETLDHATIADVLRNLVAAAAALTAARPEGDRLELSLVSLDPSTAPAGTDEAGWVVSAAGLEAPIAVAVQATATREQPEADDDGQLGNRIDVILDIDLPVVVRFGRTELPIRALSRLGPGSVIDLGRSPDDPVEVLVSNRVVARGEVVIVGGNYGVRITDVASRSERARSMEA